MMFENPVQSASPRGLHQSAFTLIELVVVIGVTIVLFSLLLIPLVSAINYTRQAQALTAAQDAARITLERITRELGSAVYVFDNTSHPFTKTSMSANSQDDHYTNFLNLQVTASDGSKVLAHAYNAKLDMVLPKLTGSNVDPTTHEPFTLTTPQNGGSAFITDPSLVFPTAPGTTMIRYFVGLKDPTLPYNNLHEGKSTANDDNTYILYRAQFQPYNSDGTVNTALFAKTTDGKRPELDDPDFFRYVNLNGATDVNWLNSAHGGYQSQNPVGGTPDGTAADHNNRVENWLQIAKPVIPGPDVDLLLLPHTTSGVPAYDGASGPFPGVAHSGVAHDPVGNIDYPVVNTSVTFRPGTISGEASPQTTTEYNSAGVPANGIDTIPYIPTVYAANSQSWAQPYTVTISTPSGATAATWMTGIDAATGDVMEYSGTPSTGTAVYDITTGTPEGTTGTFVPLSINADSGTLNFAAPALHLFTDSGSALAVATPIDNFNRDWLYTPTSVGGSYQVNLTADTTINGTQYASPLKVVANAHLVPGSLRVYGPDSTPGPNLGQPVLYTQAGTLTTAGDNMYSVDYSTGILTFSGNVDQFAAGATVRVLYDYQANMALVPPPPPTGGVLTPMTVAVDYSTRDLIDVSIGVRLYDVSSGVPQVIPAESKVKIGNSSH